MQEILQLSKELAPWLVAFLATVWLINRAFNFFLKRGKQSAEDRLAEAQESIETALVTHEHNALKRHNRTDHLFSEMVQTNKGIEQQLMLMNSGHGSTVSSHNQKKVIEYQVSWCRQRTTDIIVQSIAKNNIEGREDIVVRKVIRAFKMCSQEAEESIDSLEGMTYRYDKFFTEHLPRIWEAIIRAAIPIYHRDFISGQTLDDCILDLKLRIESWFEDALRRVLSKSEDPDTGALYRPTRDGDTAEIDGYLPLAAEIRSYQPRGVTP